jgi:hypothetical protein
MRKKLGDILDIIESRWSLAVLVSGTGVLTFITAWFARQAEWLNRYGNLGWWGATLIGFFVAAWAFVGIGWVRYIWAKASATLKWRDAVASLNPLDPEFTRQRIRISDLANPFTSRVSNKRFVDCELLGPANVVVHNADPVRGIRGVTFVSCDIVAVRQNISIQNVVVFENIDMIGGAFYRCTIFVSPPMLPQILIMEKSFSISLTGNAEWDARGPEK